MAFWFARANQHGEYVIGQGDVEIIRITSPTGNDTEAQVWARICCEALRAAARANVAVANHDGDE